MRVALQHLSLRTWLTDARTNRKFLCSLARGHALMASHHLAAAHGATADVLAALLTAYPAGARARDRDGLAAGFRSNDRASRA